MQEIEIVWEPRPTKVVNQGPRRNWTKALAPLKAAPGAEARVLRVRSRSTADYHVRTMRAAMEKSDPLGKWDFHSHQMQDVEGGYGVWACYRGQMSPEQAERKIIQRKQHSDRMKKAYAKKKLREQISADPNVTRPNLLGR